MPAMKAKNHRQSLYSRLYAGLCEFERQDERRRYARQFWELPQRECAPSDAASWFPPRRQAVVAGATSDVFLTVARSLNADGFAVACGILSENVHDRTEARSVSDEYCPKRGDHLRSSCEVRTITGNPKPPTPETTPAATCHRERSNRAVRDRGAAKRRRGAMSLVGGHPFDHLRVLLRPSQPCGADHLSCRFRSSSNDYRKCLQSGSECSGQRRVLPNGVLIARRRPGCRQACLGVAFSNLLEQLAWHDELNARIQLDGDNITSSSVCRGSGPRSVPLITISLLDRAVDFGICCLDTSLRFSHWCIASQATIRASKFSRAASNIFFTSPRFAFAGLTASGR